jgi:histidinol-phosphate phosphatase family protein
MPPDRRRRVAAPAVDGILCDRDGTLVVDVPYNGDPARVVPLPGVRAALDRLRARGVALAIVSNQSGVTRGLISSDDVAAVCRRVDELLGPFGAVVWCPHGPSDGCDCRKPQPGLLIEASRRLGVDLERCGLIGDTGADVDAALAVGARPVLVPNERTLPREVARAPVVAGTFGAAARRLIEGR